MQRNQCRSCQKGLFFCMAVWLHLSPHMQMAHTHISSALHTEKKHQMYTSIQPYILFTLTPFQQLLFPMQMSWLSPTPNPGEVIWAAQYKWLGMIDGPSHSSPSTDREKSNYASLSPSLHFCPSLSFSLTCLSIANPISHIVLYIKMRQLSTSYKPLIVL